MTDVAIPDGKAMIMKGAPSTMPESDWYWFRLVAHNGEVIAVSETYSQKHNVVEVLEKYFSNFLVEDKTGE